MPQWPEEARTARRHVVTNNSLRWFFAGLTVISRDAMAEAFRANEGMEASRIQGDEFECT